MTTTDAPPPDFYRNVAVADTVDHLTLPTDSAKRKEYPVFSGCLAYFPAALAGVATHSKRGNDKHNPGEPLHHARGKSTDHEDCIVRHLIDLADLLALHKRSGGPGPDGDAACDAILTEANALAWRALALSQRLHEKFAGAPVAPAAVEPPAGFGGAKMDLCVMDEASEMVPTSADACSTAHAIATRFNLPVEDGSRSAYRINRYGEKPELAPGRCVDVVFRSSAGAKAVRGVSRAKPDVFRWNHIESGGDIILWRETQL